MSLPGKMLLLAFLASLATLGPAMAVAQAPAPAGATEAPAAKRILVLHDENKDDLPGLGRTDRSLRDAFRAGLGRVEIHSESLGFTRAGPEHDARSADFLRSKYQRLAPDLVVAVMEAPLDFVLRHRQALFPGVPVVFASIDASTIKRKALPPDVTGVLLKRTYAPTLEVALRLQPETRNVVVVGGAAPFDRFLQDLVRRDLQPFEGRVAIEYLFGTSMEEALKRLAALPPNSVVLYVSVLRDGAGRRFVPADALASIAASANAPVYVFLDQYVGLGAVGGNVYSFATHGEHVASVGLQVLRGEPAANIPIRDVGAQADMFDARQLKRWKLDEARLPPGSQVLYREPSIWAQYRWYIAAAIALVSLQAALIGALVVARARRRRAEAEARRQRDDLAHVLRVTTLGEITSSLAHEIIQPLTAILTNADAAKRFLESGRPAAAKDVAEALADIHASADQAALVIDRLRRLFRKERVRHGAVDVKTLVEDVVHLLHAAMLVERIDIELAFDRPLPPVAGDAVQLEQVLLNVLTNASDAIGASRGGPRRITIRGRHDEPGRVVIEVADTGVGVEHADLDHIFEHFVSTKPKGLGMGLAISRSIINAHGGRIWATRNPDRGITMHIELLCMPETRPAAAAQAS